MNNARKRGYLIFENICNVIVLQNHMAGCVGGQFFVEEEQRFVGVYLFETICGSFTCCFLNGLHVYFEAKKVRIEQI